MDLKRFETPLAVGANLVFALPAGEYCSQRREKNV